MVEIASEKKPAAAKKAAKPKSEVKKTKKVVKASSEVKVTLIKSGIGKAKDQKATIKGLGFKRLNQTVTLNDTPSIRGMINKISHLVEVQ